MSDASVSNSLPVSRHLRLNRTRFSSDGVPTQLLTQAVRRLRIVVLLIVSMTAIGWIGVKIIEGGFLGEFRRPGDWIPPVVGLSASFGVYLITRSKRLSVLTILKVGLAYEVLVSLGLAFGQYWNTFHDLSGDRLTPDLVGVSSVALWMVFFTVLVPARPRHALVALVLSGAAVPATIAILIQMGNAPVMAPMDFFAIFVLPYAITAFMCMVTAQIIYGLGRDANAAQQLGSYQLLTQLGSGGMGTVWTARHEFLARTAAIKLIRPEALSTDPVTQRSVLSRFEREAQITASLESPHTVVLHDFGVSETGELFYVMELLSGIDLDDLVKRYGPLPEQRTIHIMRQVCSSLAEAHNRGLIHRDIKPANIMLCEHALMHDFVKVLDFGLAKRSLGLMSDATEGVDGTESGVLLGTPAYIAPELIDGRKDVDGRADLYLLGCVGYWLLTGHPVFEEPTAMATIAAHMSNTPVAPGSLAPGTVSAGLDALILNCLEKSPDERPASAELLAESLEALASDAPWSQSQARRWWSQHREAAGERALPVGPEDHVSGSGTTR